MTNRTALHEIDTTGANDGDVPTVDLASGRLKYAPPAPAPAGTSLTVQDENGVVATGVTQIDFQGAGVTASAGTGEVVVTIPGGTGGGPAAARQVLRLTRATSQSLPSGARTAIIWTAASRNSLTNATWSSTTNPSRITATVAGQYVMRARGLVQGGASGTYVAGHLYKNTASIDSDYRHTPSGNWGSVYVQSEVTLQVGDYLEFLIEQTTGGAKNSGTNESLWVEVEYLGPVIS